MTRKLLGNYGEQLAEQHLEAKGYVIFHRNWRYKRMGEIDLIAYLPPQKQLVFVEVKTRLNERYGNVAESISWGKQQTIRSVAEAYLALHPPKHPVEQMSFDVILIEPDPTRPQFPKISHLESAF